MKVFKPKEYVSSLNNSTITSQSPKRYTPVCWENSWEVDEIRVEYGKSYEKDMKTLSSVTKKIVKRIVSDIKKGYVYIDNPMNKESTNTHVLIDQSKNLDYIVWSKSYSVSDRVTYLVYEPEEVIIGEGDDSRTITVLPVVVFSCIGHKIGKDRQYSDTKEEP